jgi:orotate phosphoribosyltransferase
MHDGLIGSTTARRGHFLLESGHHGDLWLDLELLCLRPKQIGRSVAELSQRLSRYAVDAVCGPLTEGPSWPCWSHPGSTRSSPTPSASSRQKAAGCSRSSTASRARSAPKVRGKRVAIVNDVTNAGSAVRGAYADLVGCGAVPVALGSLVVLGDAAARFAREKNVPLVSVAHLANRVWTPAECPLCASGEPLDPV